MKIEKYRSTLDGTLFGGYSYGTIYDSNSAPIAKTGILGDVENIVKATNSVNLVSSGSLLYALIDDATVSEIEAQSASNTVSAGNLYEILDLGDETITDVISIEETSSILLATSLGRIISCGKDFLNAYMTGNKSIYANVKNGFGEESNTCATAITYALYNKIAQINESKEIEKWKFEFDASAITEERIDAFFIGPILNVKEDLGFWKELIWQETKPNDTEIVISLRSGDTIDGLVNKDWQYAYSSNIGEGTTITRELNNTTLKGQYLQVKVDMSTNTQNVTPIVSDVTINYSTKQASYFFTTKFSMANNADTNRGMIVANITEPKNTEVKLGITNGTSVDWKDYQVISPDKFFELDNTESMKIGIKFISYDSYIPEVAEFAVMVGGNIVKALNT